MRISISPVGAPMGTVGRSWHSRGGCSRGSPLSSPGSTLRATWPTKWLKNCAKALLVPGRDTAGIAVYSGRGELGSWLRVVSIRTAQRLRRRNLPAGLATDRAEQPWRDADPERDYLKLRYGAAYEEAFHAALASLSNRERLCLRLHYADGLDIDRIGRLYKIHRSTVARRLAEYRRKLRESMQQSLRKRLNLTDSEYESVLSLVRSQLVVSLRSALKNPAPAA